MARTPSINLAELVRVPLADVPCFPHFLRFDLQQDWIRSKRVEIKPDWAGRPSIDLPTAYRLQAENEADMAADEARRRAEAEKLDAAVTNAQERRQKIYTEAYLANLPGGTLSDGRMNEVRKQAWLAVYKAEKGLAPEIAMRLGGVSQNGLPGAVEGMSMTTYIPQDEMP